MALKLFVDEGLFKVDLAPWAPQIAWSPGEQFFNLSPGTEHYHLLAYLAKQLPEGAHVVDGGTLFGCSAVALAAGNPLIDVHTFDIEDQLQGPGEGVKLIPNIYFYKRNLLNAVEELLEGDQPSLILLDVDPHDGVQESTFIEHLIMGGYDGLLLLDDINLSPPMRHLWAETMERVKAFGASYNLTKWGHWSGTGAVAFNPEKLDLEIKL